VNTVKERCGSTIKTSAITASRQDALDKFTNSKGWSIGADTGVALVKVGAGGEYDTDTLKKPIIGFVFREKGLIADLSLEGTKINPIER
jgi:lipid-binding SYLF domain-containing protein